MIKIIIKNNEAYVLNPEKEFLTAGSVGVKLEFEFDAAWDNLTKSVAFLNSIDELPDVSIRGQSNIITIPYEALKRENTELQVGVYGENTDGTMVIPTIYANLGMIKRAAKKTGRPPIPPTPDWTTGIETDVDRAVKIAEDVERRADAGEFNGPAGPIGPAGPAGKDGAVGPKGETGPAGPAGKDGAAGPQGPPGKDGTDGTVGPKGDTGPAGPAGKDGATGANGKSAYEIAVKSGYEGSEVDWLKSLHGKDGKPGADGPQGSPGPTGKDGATGPKGDTGPAGPAGKDGAAGPKGDTGPAGPKGDTGPAGAKGPQGPAGAPGAAGKTPVKGVDYWVDSDKESMVQDVLKALSSTPMVKINKVWENASVTSSFDRQTIPFSWANYKLAIIFVNGASPVIISNLINTRGTAVSGQTGSLAVRSFFFTPYSAGIEISSCTTIQTYGDATSTNIRNDICVPVAIYGVGGVQ